MMINSFRILLFWIQTIVHYRASAHHQVFHSTEGDVETESAYTARFLWSVGSTHTDRQRRRCTHRDGELLLAVVGCCFSWRDTATTNGTVHATDLTIRLTCD